MKSLESRKQLLIAESELNRAQLVQEWRTMTGNVHSLADQARTLRGFASAAVTLMAVMASCRNSAAAPAAEKPSWVQTLVKVAAMVSTLWSAFSARRKT
jgi:hypothetical protein